MYGLGFGFFYLALREWLRQDKLRRVIFLEDDPYALEHFLPLKVASELLDDPQVDLIFFNGIEDSIFHTLTWKTVHKSILVISTPVYKNRSEEFIQKIYKESERKNIAINDFLDGGKGYYTNFYNNLKLLPHSYLASSFFKQFENVPAIICGAGPSLEKQLSNLKGLKNRALIFGGGSAMNVLTSNGVIPHFGLGIDPTDEQRKRLEVTKKFSFPYFYRLRVNNHALSSVRGPKLYVTGSGGYLTAKWFEERLGIQGDEIEEGISVFTFAVAIAMALGCNPLIFVGLDLSFTEGKHYAEGVVGSQENRPLNKETIVVKGEYGKDVFTVWNWVNEAAFLSELQKKRPECTFINATEGGLGVKGVKHLTLNEVMKEYLNREYDFAATIQTLQQRAKIQHVTREKIDELAGELRDSLQECVKILERMKEKQDSLVELELTSNLGYHVVLEVFDKVFNHVNRSQNPDTFKQRWSYLKECALIHLDVFKNVYFI